MRIAVLIALAAAPILSAQPVAPAPSLLGASLPGQGPPRPEHHSATCRVTSDQVVAGLAADAVILGAGAYLISDGIRRQKETRGIVNDAFNGIVGPAEVLGGVVAVVFALGDLAQMIAVGEPPIIAQLICQAGPPASPDLRR